MKKIEQKIRNKPITLDDLPQAVTHIEEYLSYLAGKTTNFAHLPTPITPVEEFLYYLCYQKHQGGGGVQLPIPATDVSYNNQSSGIASTTVQGAIDELKLDMALLENSDIYVMDNKNEFDTILPSLELKTGDIVYIVDSIDVVIYDGSDVDNDGKPVALIYDENLQTTNKFRLFAKLQENVVIDWEDLSYTTVPEKTEYKNLFNPNKVIRHKYFTTSLTTSGEWCSYVHPCSSGDKVRIVKNEHDSSTYVFLDASGGVVSRTSTSGTTTGDWNVYDFTVDNNPDIVAIGFNLHGKTQGGSDFNGNVMIFNSHEAPVDVFVPYMEVDVLIDGNSVQTTYDNTESTLYALTTQDAITELDDKKADKESPTGRKVFDSSKNVWNANYFRIPSLLRTKEGSLLATVDVRHHGAGDQTYIDLGSKRSTDNGQTWDKGQISMTNNNVDANRSRVMDATSVQTSTGKIIVLAGGWDRNTSNWESSNLMPDTDWNPYIITSTDDGVTWTDKVSLKDTCQNQPAGTVAWLGGVGTGIETSDGKVVLPIQIRYFQNVANGVGSNKVTQSGFIYSEDDGENWRMCDSFVNGSENMIVEVDDGLILHARNGNNRSTYITTDFGQSWTTYAPLHNKIASGKTGCQGSFIAFNTKSGHRIGLISTPENLQGGYVRDNITVFMFDFNNPDAGIRELLIPYPYAGHTAGGGYSSLAYGTTKDGQRKLDIIFEENGNINHKDISFLLDEIEDITSTVTLTEGTTGIELSVNGDVVSTVPYLTDSEIKEITDAIFLLL